MLLILDPRCFQVYSIEVMKNIDWELYEYTFCQVFESQCTEHLIYLCHVKKVPHKSEVIRINVEITRNPVKQDWGMNVVKCTDKLAAITDLFLFVRVHDVVDIRYVIPKSKSFVTENFVG